MPSNPTATVSISEDVLAQAGELITVFGCVGKNADITPRIFSSAKSILAQHDYAQGVDFVSMFIKETKKPVCFIGLPIVTPGTVGRQNSTGVSGSSAISVAAGSEGFLDETDCALKVTKGGTIGQYGIQFDFTADGWRTKKSVRLGTNNSYVVPFLGIVINFGAGTLNIDDVYTFVTTAPMWDQAGLEAARTALTKQQKLSRSWQIIGDLPNSTFAGYVTTETNGYETENERFVYSRCSVRDRLPLRQKSKIVKRMTGAPNITFHEVGGTGDTITRSAGSFIADGLAVGDVIKVTGSASNNVTGPIAGLTDTVITLGTTDLVDEGPVGGVTIVASEGLVFAASGHTVTRSTGSWLDDGFRVGDSPTFAGTVSNNGSPGAITALTSTVMTFAGGLVNETIGSADVDCTAGETMAGWVSNLGAAFGSVDAQKRIDMSAGRARKLSELTGWMLRRPASWAAAIREYQRDVHQTVWEKAVGPLDGWDLTDGNNTVVEYDQTNDGGLLEERFTCFRTYANGPEGAFIAMSLTRDTDGAPLSYTHNMAVANIAQTVIQAATENFIGANPELDDKGRLTDAARSALQTAVDNDLAANLMQERVVGAGARATQANWTAGKDDDLSQVNATLTGAGVLKVKGTIVNVNTVLQVS